MKDYNHGGDWRSASNQYGGDILDFSANLNPYGIPPGAVVAGQVGVAQGDSYPDPHCTALKKAIALADGVEGEQVICGNGAADLIFRLVLATAPQKALVTAPTFSEYEQALATVGCEIVRHTLSPHQQFDVTEDILTALHSGLDMVFLCTPNNPTGRIISQELLKKVAEQCRRLNIILVVDECFLALATGGSGLAPWLEEFDHLFLLRAFTKSYALAGLRLGYGLCANEGLLQSMERVGQPWNVSTPAQMAGLACLEEPDWTARARKLVGEERPVLMAGLTQLGCIPYEGAANYILFQRVGDTTLKERLLTQGILIRGCGTYHGLGEDYYRICIKKPEENQRLLQGLALVTEKEGRD